jgi:membrane-bound lytic murein transglycosylase D
MPQGQPRFSHLRTQLRRSLVLAAMLLAGCAGLTDRPAEAPHAAKPPSAYGHFSNDEDFLGSPRREPVRLARAQARPEPPQDLWARLRRGYRIDDIEHPRVEAELKRLLRHPPALQALLERARPFLRYVLDQVEERGLPSEVALLPAVESAYRPFAYSPDGAAGLWQFMPATARRFGLRSDWWQDQRRDPSASTRAALDYVELLIARFDGDVLRALAAYNAGGAKVARAVKYNQARGRPTDYWSLDLPRETDQYVPRLMALARIIAQPELFGVTLPELADRPVLAEIDTGGQIDLQVVAELAALPYEDLVTLNAGFNRSATPPDGPHRLLVPIEATTALGQALADLPPEQRLRWQRHAIRSGETLGGIARRYDVSVAAIQRANGLSGHLIRAGHDLAIPLSEATVVRFVGRRHAGSNQVSYRVRKGDSLYVIARRFQVSVADLRRWNGISGRLIKPGQQLTVYVRGGPTRL